MAEARSAVAAPRVEEMEEGREAWKDFLGAWRKAFFRRFFRTRNQIRNGLWPTHIYNLGVTCLLFSICLLGDWHWVKPINTRLWDLAKILHLTEVFPYTFLQIILISAAGGFVFFLILMYKRRWLLRILLSYRGWLYERSPTWSSKIWGAVVRLVSGWHPTTYSYQKSLPFLPVPDLKLTVNLFLESIKPLYGKDSEKFLGIQAEAEEFLKGPGPKLHHMLVLKSWWAQNWVTDWWEKYVYLMGRNSISINSNFYVMDHSYWQPTHRQISRAANFIHGFLVAKRELDWEQLTPLVLRNTIPLCMAQYERAFSTTRIPGKDIDQLIKFDSSISKHITVMHKGIYYKLDVFDKKGNILDKQTLENKLEWIVTDAENHSENSNEAARAIAALTAGKRSDWAAQRSEFFSSGVNKDSLNIVESAIFHCLLETKSFYSFQERGKYLLHGDGDSIWFDKSFNIIVFSNGKMGINAEHSWADAPVIGHLAERCLTEEVICDLYDAEGKCNPHTGPKISTTKQPERLIWEMPVKLESIVFKSVSDNKQRNDDLDLFIVDHDAYGKGFIKKCRVSPDAYIQMALQLAYFRDAGHFTLTYEASMTRLYLLGRTETVRTLSDDSVAFVRAMVDESSNNKERIELLQKASASHQQRYKDAMAGKGIDRHMFGLYVACKGLGKENNFLRNALSIPWTLSTSQQPQQQISSSPNVNLPQFQNKVSPGGGFGPVSDDGYGVSYMIPGENRLFFHVTSKHSSSKTCSKRFVQNLHKALSDMHCLLRPEGLPSSEDHGASTMNGGADNGVAAHG